MQCALRSSVFQDVCQWGAMPLPLFLGFKRVNLRLASMFGLYLFIPRLPIKASPHPVSRRHATFSPVSDAPRFPPSYPFSPTFTASLSPPRRAAQTASTQPWIPPPPWRWPPWLSRACSATWRRRTWRPSKRIWTSSGMWTAAAMWVGFGTGRAGGLGIWKTSFAVKPKRSLVGLIVQSCMCWF